MVKEITHPSYGSFQYVGTPIRYINYPLNNNSAPPVLGEHTEEVLRELLNYSPEKIDQIIKQLT